MNSEGILTLAEGNIQLTENSDDITLKIVKENDTTKLEDLTKLFELNQKKREIVRVNRLNKLQDVIDAELMTRVEDMPESIENRDLVSIANLVSNSISNVSQSINQTPIVQINNNKQEININNSGLDRASRQKVLDAVNKIMGSISLQQTKQDDIIDVDIEKDGD